MFMVVSLHSLSMQSHHNFVPASFPASLPACTANPIGCRTSCLWTPSCTSGSIPLLIFFYRHQNPLHKKTYLSPFPALGVIRRGSIIILLEVRDIFTSSFVDFEVRMYDCGSEGNVAPNKLPFQSDSNEALL